MEYTSKSQRAIDMASNGAVRIELKVGVCETCRYMACDTYNPSPLGVALSSGQMLDCTCAKEDELAEIAGDWDNFSELGTDENNQCPLWSPDIEFVWCEKHKKWSLGECDECMDESLETLAEMKKLTP